MTDSGESLVEYLNRTRTLKGTERVRVPKHYSDSKGNVIAHPVATMGIGDDNDESNPPTKYDSITTTSFYPTHPVNTAQVITNTTLTASAKTGEYQPDAGYVNEVEFIYVTVSALAAGRDLTINITDGTTFFPIWASAAGAIASGASQLIYPIDSLGTVIAATQSFGFPITCTNGTYLGFVNTDLAAAETMILRVHARVYHVEGL